VGDKVKVTRKNGDSAKFVVTSIAGPENQTRWIDGEYDEVTVNDDIASIEVVEPMLPTKPGLYRSAIWDEGTVTALHLDTNGAWLMIWPDGGIAPKSRAAVMHVMPLVRLVPEVTP
jgi:hypothetical protein